MKEFNVLLNSINDVKLFVNTAAAQMFDIDIVSGRYVIDAKSIMGLFSIDLTKPVKVSVQGTDEEGAEFYAQIKQFVV
ncbi:MAG: HPr family phosphocarrier protein [Oscillospiraceae bacterium]|nr:HPr family phosphocarrier protein [Oscillospiraceae bacterium]